MASKKIEPSNGVVSYTNSPSLDEINSLINIRDYINLMINNYNRSKDEFGQLKQLTVLVDNKIMSLILSDNFKAYVNFEQAAEAIAKAAKNNDIKSGMNK